MGIAWFYRLGTLTLVLTLFVVVVVFLLLLLLLLFFVVVVKAAVSQQSSSFCFILPITRPQSLWNLK